MAYVTTSIFGADIRVKKDSDYVVLFLGDQGRVGLHRDEAERLIVQIQNALTENPQAVTP